MKQSVRHTNITGLQKRVVSIQHGILKLIVWNMAVSGTVNRANIPSGILKLIVWNMAVHGTVNRAITTTGLWNQRVMSQIV